jgi:rieske iron-sulfur protein
MDHRRSVYRDRPGPAGAIISNVDERARRAFLRSAFGIGVGLVFAPSLAAGQGDSASARPREGALLVKVGDDTLTPLQPDDIPVLKAPLLAWPMDSADRTVRSGSRLNRVLLVKLDPEGLSAQTRKLAADGVVAYTAICTHSGCDVSDWLEAERLLYCACHQTKFDPRDAARVIDGPAPRSLPALPLKIVDGRLVVAGAFTARVGFEEL